MILNLIQVKNERCHRISAMKWTRVIRDGNQALLMSALGQKQTLKRLYLMSALLPKADIRYSDRHVRFVPKADSRGAAYN